MNAVTGKGNMAREILQYKMTVHNTAHYVAGMILLDSANIL